MPLFGGKPKVSLADFCLPFYRETVSSKNRSTMDVGGTTFELPDMGFVNAKLAEECRRQAALIDPSFIDSLDLALFDHHFAALRLECFSLAWAHVFTKKPKHALEQARFMATYLIANDAAAVWDTMLDHYSQAVGRSADGGLSDDASGRATIAAHNNTKLALYKEYTALGYSGDVCAHVLNQFFTEDRWSKTPVYLAFELLRCIGKMGADDEPLVKPDSIGVLIGNIHGMYNEPRSRLAGVEITL